MLRYCFCCCCPRFCRRRPRPSPAPKDAAAAAPVSVQPQDQPPAAACKRNGNCSKYRFHNPVARHRRAKNRNKIFLNHTMFVVPRHVPTSCASSAVFDIESTAKISRATFSVTVVPETRMEQKRESADEPTAAISLPDPPKNDVKSLPIHEEEIQTKSYNLPDNHNVSSSKISFDKLSKSAILETLQVDPDDRLITRQSINDKKFLSHSSVDCFNNNAPQQKVEASSMNDSSQLLENKKPIALVKPAVPVNQKPVEKKQFISAQPKKRSSNIGPNFTPFDEPQKVLQLTTTQINSSEWETTVTGLQNVSRLSMFHGKELRPNSLQPFARPVAKHIKNLRSQLSRAACTAVQNMFSYVPKSVESDAEDIASALFSRTADTNKFLRAQSAEALNAMVDNMNPVRCIHVITSKGIKHGNRLVRAEACRLLAREVDKLGINGTLHLPTDSRDEVITAATSMVLDNTPTSRQAAQHILAKLSEDPRGAALISSAASPNVKAKLNKTLSRIFL